MTVGSPHKKVDSTHKRPVLWEASPYHHAITEFKFVVDDALWFNTLRPRQNGRNFPDDICKCIFFNENV